MLDVPLLFSGPEYFTDSLFVIPLFCYPGGVEDKPRMTSWSSWRTVLAAALATK